MVLFTHLQTNEGILSPFGFLKNETSSGPGCQLGPQDFHSNREFLQCNRYKLNRVSLSSFDDLLPSRSGPHHSKSKRPKVKRDICIDGDMSIKDLASRMCVRVVDVIKSLIK